jgi:hypothetical protein
MISRRHAFPSIIRWATRLTTAALLAGALASPAAAQSSSPTPAPRAIAAISYPYKWMYDNHSGKCISIPGSSHKRGTQLHQYSCQNNSNFGWLPIRGFDGEQYFIRSENQKSPHEQCIAVRGNSKASGAAIVQEPCNYRHPPADERFEFIHVGAAVEWGYGWDIMRSVTSGLCVSITGNGRRNKRNNQKVVQSSCVPPKGHGPLYDQWFIFVAANTPGLPCPCGAQPRDGHARPGAGRTKT